MKTLLRWALLVMVSGGLLGCAILAGYFIHDWQVTPLAKLIPRVERKMAKMAGEPSELEKDVAVLETTFVQLRGKVLRPPGVNWINGGALTERGRRLIIMHRTGRLFQTNGEVVARLDNIQTPDNGLKAYEAFAASPDGQAYTHVPERVRFNDIEWVAGARTGLATSYTFFDPDRLCYGTRVAFVPLAADVELDAADIAPEDWKVVFETTPCLPLNTGRPAIEGLMAGGRMDFAAPSTLYLGSGDYHLDGIHTRDVGIQSEDTSYGKVIAIDLATGDNRVMSRGHRNLQGMALDGTGQLWVTEHGIRGGDELNLIREGGNYGWPETTLGTLYSGQPVPGMSYGRHDVGTAPVYAWLPSAGVSALMHIDGIDPAWDGDLLAGSLSSGTFGRSLWRIRTEGDRVVFIERIRVGHRIRYLEQFGDRIAVWLDSNDLVLFEATRRPDALQEIRDLVAKLVEPGIANDVTTVFATCNECHSYAENEHLAGPSLNGVVGRVVASTGFPDYSDSLSSLSGRWDRERLTAYLVNPEAVAPGTSMPTSGLTDGPVLQALLDVLSRIDDRAKDDLRYD